MYRQTTLPTTNSSTRNCPAPKMNSTANLLKLFVSHDRRVDVAPRATFVIALQIACNLTSVTTSLPRPQHLLPPTLSRGLSNWVLHTHTRACQAKQMRTGKEAPRGTHTFRAHCLLIRLQYMLAKKLKFYITLIYNQAWHNKLQKRINQETVHILIWGSVTAYLIYHIFMWDKYYLKIHTINLNWVAR